MELTRKIGLELEVTVPAGRASRTIAAAARRGGVECLVQGYNHRTLQGAWKVVPDATVHSGAELVSPPTTSLLEVERVVGALQADPLISVDRSCGFHIHLDASDLRIAHWRRLAKLWIRFETALDAVQPPSRRGHAGVGGGAPLATGSYAAQWARIDAASNLRGLARALTTGRYYKLNFQSYWRHGTVEIRVHAGTKNAQKVLNWIKLCVSMVNHARRGTDEIPAEAGSLAELFDMLEANPSIINGGTTAATVTDGSAREALLTVSEEVRRAAHAPRRRTARSNIGRLWDGLDEWLSTRPDTNLNDRRARREMTEWAMARVADAGGSISPVTARIQYGMWRTIRNAMTDMASGTSTAVATGLNLSDGLRSYYTARAARLAA